MPIANLITSTTDPTIQMVRDYSVILQDQSAFPANVLMRWLNSHAFPRIRGALLNATDSEQKHIFYTELSDLSNPAAQVAADQLVTSVMTDSIVKDDVYRIASVYSAAWALLSLVAQIPEQQKNAQELMKQADADLMLLVRSPKLSAAAAAAAVTTGTKVKAGTLPRIYITLDVDPSTYDSTTLTAKTYDAAQENGTATVWIGAYSVTAPVYAGDQPYMIMQRIGAQVRAQLMTNPIPGARFNLVLGPNEGPLTPVNRYIPDPANPNSFVFPSIFTTMGFLEFHAYQYDPNIDALFCTIELTNASGKLGIKGLLYGEIVDETEYEKLSANGPASVFIDISQGKGTSAAKTAAAVNTNTNDTFWFQILAGKTSANGLAKYQIANLGQMGATAPASPQPRIVQIPAGSTALDVAKLIANDINQHSFDQKVLGAVRTPTPATIMDDPVDVPGLRIVPYRPSGFENQIVFDLLEVPPEVTFGVLPPSFVTNDAFDNQMKSLVLASLFVQAQASKLSPLSTLTGEAKSVQGQPSSLMQGAIDDWKYFNTSY